MAGHEMQRLNAASLVLCQFFDQLIGHFRCFGLMVRILRVGSHPFLFAVARHGPFRVVPFTFHPFIFIFDRLKWSPRVLVIDFFSQTLCPASPFFLCSSFSYSWRSSSSPSLPLLLLFSSSVLHSSLPSSRPLLVLPSLALARFIEFLSLSHFLSSSVVFRRRVRVSQSSIAYPNRSYFRSMFDSARCSNGHHFVAASRHKSLPIVSLSNRLLSCPLQTASTSNFVFRSGCARLWRSNASFAAAFRTERVVSRERAPLNPARNRIFASTSHRRSICIRFWFHFNPLNVFRRRPSFLAKLMFCLTLLCSYQSDPRHSTFTRNWFRSGHWIINSHRRQSPDRYHTFVSLLLLSLLILSLLILLPLFLTQNMAVVTICVLRSTPSPSPAASVVLVLSFSHSFRLLHSNLNISQFLFTFFFFFFFFPSAAPFCKFILASL